MFQINKSIGLWAAAGLLSLGVGGYSVLEANEPEPGSVTGKYITEERVKTRGDTSQKDLVVYLVPKAEVKYAPVTARVRVVQEKLSFSPHVVAAQAGSTIVFENKDTVTHNVFADESCCGVDLDMEAGKESELKVDEAGVVPVICRLHPDMELFIIVLDAPWFGQGEFEKIKGDDGTTYEASYSIADVPPGDYTLTYWNKTLDVREFDVTVEAGKELIFDILD